MLSGGKIGYYADFIIYAVLLFALAAVTLRGSRSDQLIWLGAAIAGAGSWTLVEYILHRFVFHRMPLIAKPSQKTHLRRCRGLPRRVFQVVSPLPR
jgi:hypothetical protein